MKIMNNDEINLINTIFYELSQNKAYSGKIEELINLPIDKRRIYGYKRRITDLIVEATEAIEVIPIVKSSYVELLYTKLVHKYRKDKPENKEEIAMSSKEILNNTPIVENIKYTLIKGRRAENVSNDEILQIIKEIEEQISTLKSIKTRSLVKDVTVLGKLKNIEDLVNILDSRIVVGNNNV